MSEAIVIAIVSGIALVAAAGIPAWAGLLSSRRTEKGVEQINQQVNHVEDPETEPTVRDLAVSTHDLSVLIRHEQWAQRAEMSALAEHQAETRKLIETHLAAHQAEDDATQAAHEGRVERRQP